LKEGFVLKSKKKYAEKFIRITPKDYEELEDRHKKLDIFSHYEFERILDVGFGDGKFLHAYRVVVICQKRET